MNLKILDESSMYYKIMEEAERVIESEFGISSCFSGICGSFSWGLQNSSSDIDILMLTELPYERGFIILELFSIYDLAGSGRKCELQLFNLNSFFFQKAD